MSPSVPRASAAPDRDRGRATRSSGCSCSPTASPSVTASDPARGPRRSSQDAGVEVLVPAGEVVKHRILAPFSSGDGMRMQSGGEDLILVLGGDGSILRALAREAGSGAPVIGVNYGRVGFLASIERETPRARPAPRAGGRVRGARAALAEGRRGPTARCMAVNDLALFRGGDSRIADLTYAVDDELVATVRCDGVILSTPGRLHGLQPGGRRPDRVVAGALLRAVVHRAPPPRQPPAGDRRRGAADRHQQRADRRLRRPGRRPADRRAAARAARSPSASAAPRCTWRRSPRHPSSGATGRSSAGRDPLARGPRPGRHRAGRAGARRPA